VLHRICVSDRRGDRHEFLRHSSHKADDDFLALLWKCKARIKTVYEFRQWYKLDGGAVVKESC